MTAFDLAGFGERLRIAMKGESVNGFGRRAGIPEGSLRQYLAGSMPGADKLAAITEAADVSADWLLLGRGQKRQESLATVEGPAGLPPEFALLPRYDVSASAGHGLVPVGELEVERIAFRMDWLRESGLDPRQAALLTAAGDSMHPTIPDGALILVDKRADQPIRSGFIYVIILDGEVLVKRLSRNVDGTIDLISDNPLYPVKSIRQTDFDRLTIAGRVFWVGRKL